MSVEMYLVRPGEAGAANRFYEIKRQGTAVTLRYGNVDRPGLTRRYELGSEAEAKRMVESRARRARAKGYRDDAGGSPSAPQQKPRKSRARRGARAAAPKRVPPKKPRNHKIASTLEWKFRLGARAFAIFADGKGCWCGNEDGLVFNLSHKGEVRRQLKLPDGIRCIVSDGAWMYAGCNDGQVYDIGGEVPRVAYRLAQESRILWLDIYDANLYASDARGQLTAFDHEGDQLWSKPSTHGGKDGWMLRCDAHGVYQGDSKGAAAYALESGELIWRSRFSSPIYFGWQERDALYVGCRDGRTHALEKARGVRGQVFEMSKSKGPVLFSCAAAPEGKLVFAADNHEQVYCFDASGALLWKMPTKCGSAYSMQYHDERLYLVTSAGYLGCLDLTEATLEAQLTPQRAPAGRAAPKPPKPRDIKAPKREFIAPTLKLERATDIGGGVLLHCVKEGGRLRVRVLSEGYNPEWNVQFPRDLREEGARFVVDEIHVAARGGFYRVQGDIRRYEGEA